MVNNVEKSSNFISTFKKMSLLNIKLEFLVKTKKK